MITPDPRREYTKNELKSLKWQNTIIWVLLCLFGTGVTIFLIMFVPNGHVLTYPVHSVVLDILFLLFNVYFMGIDAFVFVITGLYLGIIFAMLFSRDRRHIFAAIALIALYLVRMVWMFVSVLRGMT
jgi:cellulose synthase/poly-beta-1,6-N-acetylglucosamine synthase-like glycosyltransferase